jgi:Rps23 Pro-64 3,4-dihydroxylase Tpa1-like proline 4-hydroxylase
MERLKEHQRKVKIIMDSLCIFSDISSSSSYDEVAKSIIMTIHTDQDTMGSDGSWFTFLYYVGPVWNPEWGGATVFNDRDTGALQLYYPNPNSAVLFDAAIWHQGQEPTRQCQELRVTVAWKLQKL